MAHHTHTESATPSKLGEQIDKTMDSTDMGSASPQATPLLSAVFAESALSGTNSRGRVYGKPSAPQKLGHRGGKILIYNVRGSMRRGTETLSWARSAESALFVPKRTGVFPGHAERGVVTRHGGQYTGH